MKSLTGLGTEKFKELLSYFEVILEEENSKRIRNNKDRKRKAGGGQKSTLYNAEVKLFYILFYVKVYPTFDVAGFIYDVHKAQTHRWMHQLLPILEKALGRRVVLPERQIENIEAFMKLFPEVKDLFIDGTERRVERSSEYKKQKLDYSGKKKTHTRKNVVVNDEKRRILIITPTVKGSMHDKRIYDKYSLGDTIPKEVTQWVDTGFQGIAKDYDIDVQMPKKNTKKHKLSFEEKENNKTIAGIRIISEHAIGGIKRMRSVSDIYRNRRGNTDDKLMLVSAGIWNLFIA